MLHIFSYLDGSSDIGKALEYVRTDLIHSRNTGARSGAEKVIFLFTTGRNGENAKDPLEPALKLKKKGVKIFVLHLVGRFLYRYYYGRRSEHFRSSYIMRRIASTSKYLLSARSHAAFYRVTALLRIGKEIF